MKLTPERLEYIRERGRWVTGSTEAGDFIDDLLYHIDWLEEQERLYKVKNANLRKSLERIVKRQINIKGETTTYGSTYNIARSALEEEI